MTRWDMLLSDEKLLRIAKLPFAEAHKEARNFLTKVAYELSPEVRGLLLNFKSFEEFKPSLAMVEALDDAYFDLEEKETEIEANDAFSAARFASACYFFNAATDLDYLMNAIYEAHHARR